jgi:serine protease Do
VEKLIVNDMNFSKALNPRRFILAFAALALVLGVATNGAWAKSAPESFADLAEKLLPAVVNVSTTQVIEGQAGVEMPQLPPGSPFEEFFKDFMERGHPRKGPRKRKATSLGSGFIIDSSGYVVTNNHVIKDADEITVIFQNDKRLKATLVGRDQKTDLAVLKVESKESLPSIGFGDSSKSRVGDWIVAIGNPFGLGGTVTAGIISARGRDINSGPYDDFIQTDASINRGNSGGPMFNLDGEVIGINTAIFSPSGGSVGIGFAIPSVTAQPIIQQLIDTGEVRRGWLGVHIQTVSDEIAETLGMKETKGALVASVVKGGPAEKAKIRSGDVILEFDGKDVQEMRLLPRIVAETGVDKTVDVTVWRNGEEVELSVSVGELEEEDEASALPRKEEADNGVEEGRLGLVLSQITDPLRERFDLADDITGVLIIDVDEDSKAAEKGVRPGDVIADLNQEEVKTPQEVIDKVNAAREAGRKSVMLRLEGRTNVRFVVLPIGKK